MRIDLKFDDAGLRKAFKALEVNLPKTLAAAMWASLDYLVADVVLNRLSGQYLHRRTGTLQRSITASPRVVKKGRGVRGVFGSHLEYARKHEEGFEGFVDIPAHTRAPHAVRAHQRALKTGRVQIQAHRRRGAEVQAYRQYQVIQGRHFLRDTVKEGQPVIEKRFRRAIAIALVKNRVPTKSELQVV